MSRAYDVQASLGAGLLLVLLCYTLYSRLFEHKRLPPGPKPIPLLGNILQVPYKYKEKTFTEWGSKYGSYSLVIFCAVMVSQLTFRYCRRYCLYALPQDAGYLFELTGGGTRLDGKEELPVLGQTPNYVDILFVRFRI